MAGVNEPDLRKNEHVRQTSIADTASRDETRGDQQKVAAVLEGVLDPVYEAKALILNREVNHLAPSFVSVIELTPSGTDSKHWHGLVSMAAFHRCWVWLGQ